MVTPGRGLVAVLALIISCTGAFACDTVYKGSLSDANDGLKGNGAWIDKSQLKPREQKDWTAPTISWTVTQDHPGGMWHYEYTFNVYKYSVSHVNLETSRTFTDDNIEHARGPFCIYDVGPISQGSGNPGMPGALYGIKFDSTWGTNVTISFDSDRQPVWGDIYLKGSSGAIWNAGFTLNDTDPSDRASNGSVMNSVLVPDTFNEPPVNPVPEPSSLAAMMSTSAVGLLFRRRSTKRE